MGAFKLSWVVGDRCRVTLDRYRKLKRCRDQLPLVIHVKQVPATVRRVGIGACDQLLFFRTEGTLEDAAYRVILGVFKIPGAPPETSTFCSLPVLLHWVSRRAGHKVSAYRTPATVKSAEA
jgi:hypothetical protein